MSVSEILYLADIPPSLMRKVRRNKQQYANAIGQQLYTSALSKVKRRGSMRDMAQSWAVATANLISDGQILPAGSLPHSNTDTFISYVSFYSMLRDAAFTGSANESAQNSELLYNVWLDWLGVHDNEWVVVEESAKRRRKHDYATVGTIQPLAAEPVRRTRSPKLQSVSAPEYASLKDALANAENKIPVEQGVRYRDDVFTSYLNVLKNTANRLGLNADDLIRKGEIEILEEIGGYSGRHNPIVSYVVH
jgi:hypothetical protein